MKPALKRTLAAFFLAIVVAGSAGLYVATQTATIIVFHTNDNHGWIMPHPAPDPKSSPVGGFAALANCLKKFPKGYLLLDSGDIFQGTPEGNLTGGESVIECMNALGYTAMAVGNHDYDLGQPNLARLSRIAKFPFLSCNVLDAKTGRRVAYAQPYLIKEINGLKVGIVGILTSKMPTLTLPRNIQGLRFENEARALSQAMKELKEKGAQVVIVASHVGFEKKPSLDEEFQGEKYLASQVPGIALILGGHSHAPLLEAYQDEKNKTVIVHNKAELKTVSKTVLRVWRRNGKLFSYSSKLIDLKTEKLGEDAVLKEIVKKYQEKVNGDLDTVVGTAAITLSRSGDGETLLGNWQADLLRSFAKTDFAFQNIGGIRADLLAGPLTLRHFYFVSPFENTIVTMHLTGHQIKEILETSVGEAPGILQVSGLQMVYDRSAPKGKRVEKIEAGGKSLELDRVYKVATNDFLATGGDRFGTFIQGKNVRNLNLTLRDLEVEYAKKNSPITARLDGRIKPK